MGRDPREIPLVMESLRIWRSLNARLGTETGFRQTGTPYICPDDAACAKRAARLTDAHEHGVKQVNAHSTASNHCALKVFHPIRKLRPRVLRFFEY